MAVFSLLTAEKSFILSVFSFPLIWGLRQDPKLNNFLEAEDIRFLIAPVMPKLEEIYLLRFILLRSMKLIGTPLLAFNRLASSGSGFEFTKIWGTSAALRFLEIGSIYEF